MKCLEDILGNYVYKCRRMEGPAAVQDAGLTLSAEVSHHSDRSSSQSGILSIGFITVQPHLLLNN